MLDELKICVVGLGYVGLPLAVEFGKKFTTIGYDTKFERIVELRAGKDSTREVAIDELNKAKHLRFTDDQDSITACNFIVVAVPTPIDESKRPDLGPLIRASEAVANCLSAGDIVVYESTVYPGVTEEVCAPILERVSGLSLNQDFFLGYSPERVNPGDVDHRIPNIIKVTSGSTPETAKAVDHVYRQIVPVGTHMAPSIRVAEAAKVIENTQRDLNIALMNELAMIFNRLCIDTEAVLAAAGTKWNFLPFRPGLVGGHCIGVDPYYLTYKAEQIGYHPQIILSGRRINDGMGAYIAKQMVKAMLQRSIQIVDARVLVLGLTFKENCRDLRNTRVIDVVRELNDFGISVDIFDPLANSEDAISEYGVPILQQPDHDAYDGIVLAVAHDEFRQMGSDNIRRFGKDAHVLYDIKNLLSGTESDIRL